MTKSGKSLAFSLTIPSAAYLLAAWKKCKRGESQRKRGQPNDNFFRHGRWINKQNHDNQNQVKTTTGSTVFLRFFFVPASSSDGGGFAVWWVMAVRGIASHKPSSNNGNGRSPLTMAQIVFLVLVIKLRTKTTGLIGWADTSQRVTSNHHKIEERWL